MEWSSEYPPQEQELVYALDIGTRSVIGVLAKREQDRMHVLMVENSPIAEGRCWMARSKTSIR